MVSFKKIFSTNSFSEVDELVEEFTKRSIQYQVDMQGNSPLIALYVNGLLPDVFYKYRISVEISKISKASEVIEALEKKKAEYVMEYAERESEAEREESIPLNKEKATNGIINDYTNTYEYYPVIDKIDDGELKFYSRYLGKNGSVLFVGCGIGDIIIELVKMKKAEKYMGINLFHSLYQGLCENIEAAREMYSQVNKTKIEIIDCRIEEFVTSDKYDLIIFRNEAISFVKKNNIMNEIKRYMRYLKDDGRLILTSANYREFIPENCKERLVNLKKYEDGYIIVTECIEKLDEEEYEYIFEVKQYDKYGNMIKRKVDDFKISSISDEYWELALEDQNIIVEKWATVFSEKYTGPENYYSVIVIKKNLTLASSL